MDDFGFDRVVDRRGGDSIKWNKYAGRDVLPLWVADMDFAAPPAVVEALHRRVEHGVFGYPAPMPSLVEATCWPTCTQLRLEGRGRTGWSGCPGWSPGSTSPAAPSTAA
jgi:bifunctional pyridoxal-dependent enzyme with beta-cystathionase and maltose regulon repressor activities